MVRGHDGRASAMLGKRWRDLAVPVAGVVLLVASFLPWYGIGIAGAGFVDQFTFSGWETSWMWSLALVLALVAAGVWRPFRRDFGAIPNRIRYGLLGMTLVAIGLAVWQSQLLNQSAALRNTLLATIDATDLPPALVANLQVAAQLEGVRWGYVVGLAAMALIALAILTSGSAGGRRPTARGN
jgi:hypothetical protein